MSTNAEQATFTLFIVIAFKINSVYSQSRMIVGQKIQ